MRDLQDYNSYYRDGCEWKCCVAACTSRSTCETSVLALALAGRLAFVLKFDVKQCVQWTVTESSPGSIDLFVKWRPAGLTGQLFAAAARIPRAPI